MKSRSSRQIENRRPFFQKTLLFNDKNQEIWSKCAANLEKVPNCTAGRKMLKTTGLRNGYSKILLEEGQ